MKLKTWLLGALALLSVGSCEPAYALVSNTTVETVSALGTGSTTVYTISFDFRDNTELAVTLVDESTTPWTVSTVSEGAGAGKWTPTSGTNPAVTITMGTAPTTTQYIVMSRVIPFTQTTHFDPAQAFPASNTETSLDLMVLELQNLNFNLNNAVQQVPSTAVSPTPQINPPVASNFLQFDAADNNISAWPGVAPTLGAVPYWNGTAWTQEEFTGTNILALLNASGGLIQSSVGGTGVSNGGTLTWGSNNLTFTLSGDTNITVPSGNVSLLANPMTSIGQYLYGGASGVIAAGSANTTTTRKYLGETGTGSAGQAPTLTQPAFSELSGAATLAQLPTIPQNSVMGNLGPSGAPSPLPLSPVPTVSPTTTPAEVMALDGSNNATLNVMVEGFATVATSGSSDTLTNQSAPIRTYTGSTAQTIQLPATATLQSGWQFYFIDGATAALSVTNAAASAVCTVPYISTYSFSALVTYVGSSTWACSIEMGTSSSTPAWPVALGGTGLAVGTSGGVTYFNATNTMASSALLAQHGIVLGGGAGAAPATLAVGGTGTLLAGSTGANPAFSATPTLGVASTTTGQITLQSAFSANGSTVTPAPSPGPSVATTFALPPTNGSNGQPLTTNGSGVSTWANLGTGVGGTGVTSVTTAPTASSFSGWDANKNMSANDFIGAVTSTAMAGGNTVLTYQSTQNQVFTGTGSTNQTCTLPTTSVVAGQEFTIYNASTGTGTINVSGPNGGIVTLSPFQGITLTATTSAPNNNNKWEGATVAFTSVNTLGLSLSNGSISAVNNLESFYSAAFGETSGNFYFSYLYPNGNASQSGTYNSAASAMVYQNQGDGNGDAVTDTSLVSALAISNAMQQDDPETGTYASTGAFYGLRVEPFTFTKTSNAASIATYAGINLDADSSTTTITTKYGVKVGAISGSATTTYGLYVGAMTSSGSGYGIYEAGGATTGNYLGSATEIHGVATLDSTLAVTGAITESGGIKTGSHVLIPSASPTFTSGGCGGTGVGIANSNGPAAFVVNVGATACSGSQPLVIGMPTADNGWNCFCTDVTTNSTTQSQCKQTAVSATSVTLTNFSDIAGAAAWVASDKVHVSCFAY